MMKKSTFLKGLLIVVLIFLGACAQLDSTPIKSNYITQELLQDTAIHLLRSTVRITAVSPFMGTATGTGVVVYSRRRNVNSDPRFYTYILTCAHVVENPNANPIQVEAFYYLDNNSIIATANFPAEIVVMDQSIDVAVLQVISPKPFQDVVALSSPGYFYQHQIYNSVYVVGCALGKLPSITNGNVSSFQDSIDLGDHTMYDMLKITSPTIYGNSGGGVYGQDGLLLGLAQSIDLINNSQAYEHSAYAVPIWKIALFLQENHLDFIIGGNSSFEEFKSYKLKKNKQVDLEVQEENFRKSLLDALDKLNNISPIISITIVVPPAISPIQSTISPIQSATPNELPKNEFPKKTWH